MSADHETISRTVRISDGLAISASTTHLDHDQMQVVLSNRADHVFTGTSYLTVDQARRLAAALVECADQYETVRLLAGGES